MSHRLGGSPSFAKWQHRVVATEARGRSLLSPIALFLFAASFSVAAQLIIDCLERLVVEMTCRVPRGTDVKYRSLTRSF